MSKILTSVLLLVFCVGLAAQNKIAYVAASSIFPGSGEILMGKETRGAVLLGIDILSIAGFVNSSNQMDKLSKSYKQYAHSYAGVGFGNSDQYYQRIQNYISSDEFNTLQEMLARNYYLIYNYDPESFAAYMEANTYTGDETWQWDSTQHWKQYKSLRRDHQKAKMNNNLLLGVLILNRVVSVIDVLFINSSDLNYPL
ncbi:MAG: hypothetical protein U1C33_01840, partial [Candidatus Cloacimonadaceae bacterium]|nr:hypothetical protein [Candidatus Cloacimonadaceae bacterium]